MSSFVVSLRWTAGAAAALATFWMLSQGSAEAAATSPPVSPGACTALTQLKLADTAISSASVVQKGGLGFPGTADLPAFCRVTAHVRAAPDSDIGIEVWLPLDGWSGVFHGNGNGGFAGLLASGYAGMATGLRHGYATATTDTGTAPATPLEGDALTGHPRKWKDWGRLSTHVMTATGKAIVKAFYGRGTTHAYYTGCSTGGQQGLIEALYYPADYDGILVGAPVINRTLGHTAVLWDFAAAHRTPTSLLSDQTLRLLNSAAIATCARQGRAMPGDPFVSDPLRCTFDPQEIACRDGATTGCLTPEEVATARAFYAGPTTRGGKHIFFGWLPGSEGPGRFGWAFLESASNGQPQFGGLFKWVFGKDWTWNRFDLDRDMQRVDATLAADVNDATRGSLKAFRARGGKLIVYHGLADTLVPPGQSVAFFQRQTRALGGSAHLKSVARLFMAPGMMHCAGGAGPDAFNSAIGGAAPPPGAGPDHDLFQALVQWTENGRAPEQVIATKFTDDRQTVTLQRPICAFPQQAAYRGAGDRSSAASFICRAR